jgi:hypothetical protein
LPGCLSTHAGQSPQRCSFPGRQDADAQGAGRLQAGQQLLTADGALATIIATSREELASPVSVYNLEVAGTWTYFVEDGRGEQAAVWVQPVQRRTAWQSWSEA